MSQLQPFDAVLPGPAGGQDQATQLQPLFHLVDGVEAQIRFADSKAACLATIHTLLVGPLVYNVPTVRLGLHAWDAASRAVLVGLGLTYGLLFLSSMALVSLAVLPRLRRPDRAGSRLFFGQIAREFGDDPGRFVALVSAMSDRDWVDELGVNIVDVSRIASTKHRFVRRATVLTVASVVAWCVLVVALLVLH